MIGQCHSVALELKAGRSPAWVAYKVLSTTKGGRVASPWRSTGVIRL